MRDPRNRWELDRVESVYDRLGRVVETRRSAAGGPPVVWRATFDSLGRRLTWREPGPPEQTTSYDEDGNPLETWWWDGGVRRSERLRYDGLGRLTQRVLAHAPTTGDDVIESIDPYFYDGHYNGAPPSTGSGLGQLTAPTNDATGAYKCNWQHNLQSGFY